MAGGIDWFRWHHGSATDPKFRLVAKRAGARTSEVLAVWACLLEAASASEDRGNAGDPDFEAMDLALDMDEGTASRIYEHLCARSVIEADTGRVVAWEKRQPKRERQEDVTAAERKRNQRERDAAIAIQPQPEEAISAQVTPCHATSHQEKPRGEERREEPSSPSAKKGARAAPAARADRPNDVDESVWRDWLALRKAKKAPVTPTVVDGAAAEASKAGMSLEAFLRVWCARGSQGLQAEWLKPNERPSQGPALVAQQPEWKRDRAHHLAVTTGGLLGKFKNEPETLDVAAERIG